MPEKKYLDEIEEILEQAETRGAKHRAPRIPKVRRKFPPVRLPSLEIGAAVSPGWLMLAGVAALVVAMILRPFFSSLMAPLLWLGLGLFILAYILFLVRPRIPRYEKRWRGRPVEDQPSLWERIKRGLRGF